MVEEEEEEDVDLKLEVVEPSSDWVVAAILWLLAFSSFLTAVPSSVTKAWDCAFIASLTWEECDEQGAWGGKYPNSTKVPTSNQHCFVEKAGIK